MPESRTDPYVSIVATSRNDNHGGDLLQRMQVFINCTALLARQFELPVELLLVEWNPPTDRARLADALDWPDSGGFCTYRIVEVPPELHAQLDTSASLPLYQMIAKNVGIRRAAAPYVLATNVDIIPSKELFAWLKKRQLRPGYLYRVDRYDVATEVIDVAGVEHQLDFCNKNLLRVNCRFGTYPLESVGSSQLAQQPSLNALVRAEIKRRASDALYHGLKRMSIRVGKRVVNAMLDFSIRNVARFGRNRIRATRRSLSTWTQWLRRLKQPADGQTASRSVVFLRRWINRLISRRRFDHLIAATYQVIPYFRVHTNACGDFTLMAKSDWMRLRGYAEFEMYSWHLDSLLCYAADHAGIIESVIPHAVYHIEHTGGWSPDSAEELFGKLKARGIGCLTNNDLANFEWEMSRTSGEFQFNEEPWGFALYDLPDYQVRPTDVAATSESNETRIAIAAA